MKRVAYLMIALAWGCSDDAGPDQPVGARLIWDPAGGLLGVFPDDAFSVDDPTTRTGVRVQVDPQAIPEVAKLTPNFQDIFGDLNTLDGFGVTAGIALRFDQAIDPTSLLSAAAMADASATADWSAPIVLVTLDASGPTLRAYEVQPLEDGDTVVIIEPMKPLPPGTKAFVAITSKVRDALGRKVAAGDVMMLALAGDDTGSAATERVAPRMRAAAELVAMRGGGTVDDVAGAVVFTTQSLHAEGLAIAAHVAARDVDPLPGTACTNEVAWRRCTGTFSSRDYRGTDGVLGDPTTSGVPDTSAPAFTLTFTAWLPLGGSGKSGRPTLVFAHGMGGSRLDGRFLADAVAPLGVATIAIDAVAHGAHPTTANASGLGSALDFFAISLAGGPTFKPLRLREHWRQSTFDQLQLVRMIEGGVDFDGDKVPDFDRDRLMFMGVSLGGIMGPALLALSPSMKLGVLTVAGGRVANIVRDSAQFMMLIGLVRPPSATDGDVARFFPVIQTLMERGDAAVWATQLLKSPNDRTPGFPLATPHILMENVIDDQVVPNSSNWALARALGITLVPRVFQPIAGVAASATAPIMDNLPDGRTAGLLQFGAPLNHSSVVLSTAGVRGWQTFIQTWLDDGHPIVVDPYAADM